MLKTVNHRGISPRLAALSSVDVGIKGASDIVTSESRHSPEDSAPINAMTGTVRASAQHIPR